jgi:hypothetical protein
VSEPERKLYCRRCDDVVHVVSPWSGWKRVRMGWGIGVVLLACTIPVWAADFCIMIPSSFAYLVAGSVLFRLANERPSCGVCSLEIAPDTHAGTGVRPRPARDAA